MTPALRAQLARKYNMRPEDYTYDNQWDYVRRHKFYVRFLICCGLLALTDWYISRVCGYQNMLPSRINDGFSAPWVQFNYGQYNEAGNHRRGFRWMGRCQNFEDSRMERWGTREMVNYTIDGWEDLDKVPNYLHEY